MILSVSSKRIGIKRSAIDMIIAASKAGRPVDGIVDAIDPIHGALAVAMLMISAIPTYSWSSIRLRRSWRLFALAGVGLLGAALVTAPWQTLLAVCALYVTLLPFGVASYARIRRRG